VPSLPHTNEVIGALRHRRREHSSVRLLRQAARKGHLHGYRFCDFHTAKAGKNPTLIETGDHLGQIHSELKKDEIIGDVVCAGPKNYAYKTYNSTTGESKTVCKVGGITLNYSASQLVNFTKIKI
jgi:hypothetical protein